MGFLLGFLGAGATERRVASRFFHLVVTSFCIRCPVGGVALAAVPRHPDLGFKG
jgi:hypothetical protein